MNTSLEAATKPHAFGFVLLMTLALAMLCRLLNLPNGEVVRRRPFDAVITMILRYAQPAQPIDAAPQVRLAESQPSASFDCTAMWVVSGDTVLFA